MHHLHVLTFEPRSRCAAAARLQLSATMNCTFIQAPHSWSARDSYVCRPGRAAKIRARLEWMLPFLDHLSKVPFQQWSWNGILTESWFINTDEAIESTLLQYIRHEIWGRRCQAFGQDLSIFTCKPTQISNIPISHYVLHFLWFLPSKQRPCSYSLSIPISSTNRKPLITRRLQHQSIGRHIGRTNILLCVSSPEDQLGPGSLDIWRQWWSSSMTNSRKH